MLARSLKILEHYRMGGDSMKSMSFQFVVRAISIVVAVGAVTAQPADAGLIFFGEDTAQTFYLGLAE